MGNSVSWLAQALTPEEQALWVAAKSGDAAVIREGLARLTPEKRHYLEWKDPLFGYTPLAAAAAEGHVQCVLALLGGGVDANPRDAKGLTPLHVATRYGKSEVVRVLVEAPGVNVYARTAIKRQTPLELARDELAGASYDQSHRLVQCLEILEKKLCVYSGWLYQRVDNLLSLASGISSLNSWKRRYCMILHTADEGIVEIDLFAMRPGEKRPPSPCTEIVYKLADGFQESRDSTWFNSKEFRFSLSGYTKSGINRVSAPQVFDFAALSQQELVAWKTFFASLRVGVMPTRVSTSPGDSVPSRVPMSMLDEQRQLERAMQLSLEESRQHEAARSNDPSSTSMAAVATAFTAVPTASIPAATAPEWRDSVLGSPQATLADDGVEIIQPLALSRPRDEQLPSAPSLSMMDDESKTGGKASDDECVICFDGPQAAVCVPCGHNAICMDCAGELLSSTRQCPVCRMRVREVVRLYRV